MKPSEIIDKALTEYLPTEDRWLQGEYGDGDKHCMVGALAEACGFNEEGYLINEPVYDKAYDAVALLARDLTGYTTVATFNDAEGRAFEEVRAVMEKARAGLQEQGQ